MRARLSRARHLENLLAGKAKPYCTGRGKASKREPGSVYDSERNQFSSRVAPLFFLEAFDKMPGAGRGEFLGVRAIDQRLQALAASKNWTHGNLPALDFDHPARLFEKCAVPAARFLTP